MNQYRNVLGDLEKKLTRLDQERTEVMTAITAIKKIVGMETPGRGPSATGRQRSPYEGKTVLEASKVLMRSQNHPIRAGEIARTLLEAGFPTGSSNFANTVFRTLSQAEKDKRGIVHIGGRDGWALTEWTTKGAA